MGGLKNIIIVQSRQLLFWELLKSLDAEKDDRIANDQNDDDDGEEDKNDDTNDNGFCLN